MNIDPDLLLVLSTGDKQVEFRLSRHIAEEGLKELGLVNDSENALLIKELRSEVTRWSELYGQLRAEGFLTTCEGCPVTAQAESLEQRLKAAVADVIHLAAMVDERDAELMRLRGSV